MRSGALFALVVSAAVSIPYIADGRSFVSERSGQLAAILFDVMIFLVLSYLYRGETRTSKAERDAEEPSPPTPTAISGMRTGR